MDLLDSIQRYWNGRHAGYSKVNQKELDGPQRARWQRELAALLPLDKQIHVLDVGTGPGFFPIILSEMGIGSVTAIDYSPEMLTTAQANAARYLSDASRIQWYQMDAQQLDFPSETFDVIVTRNLTWNLEHPDVAYKEWLRVLKPGGQLFVFDANWYAFMTDNAIQETLVANREQAKEEQLEDYWEGEGVDEAAMDAIVRELPLTVAKRPKWDVSYLESQFDVEVSTVEDFGARVWSREEVLNYAATPMFLIAVKKVTCDE